MFTESHLLRISLAMLQLLMAGVQGFSQSGGQFSIGETIRFEVNQAPGTIYCWKVMEDNYQKNGSETDKVTYLTTKCNPSVLVKWQTAGNYFITVTGFNENGCSNMKVFQIVVSDNHIPVAVDDYVSTSWAKSISMDLLSNDYDIKNDIDPSSLRILSIPEYGSVKVEEHGRVNYQPVRKYKGRDKFYYSICDSCNQCATAMVTIELTEPPIYIPQGISPNGDGINDAFVITGLKSYPNTSLTIFSREGISIYHSDDYQNDWTGIQDDKRSNRLPVPSGTYYYLLHLGGTSRVIKGFVYLTR